MVNQMQTCELCIKGLVCEKHEFKRIQSYNPNGPAKQRSRRDLRINNPNPVEMDAPAVDVNKGNTMDQIMAQRAKNEAEYQRVEAELKHQPFVKLKSVNRS